MEKFLEIVTLCIIGALVYCVINMPGFVFWRQRRKLKPGHYLPWLSLTHQMVRKGDFILSNHHVSQVVKKYTEGVKIHRIDLKTPRYEAVAKEDFNAIQFKLYRPPE